MGVWVSPRVGKSAAKALFAMLLAGSAAGCSSDVSRFGGLFSSQDSMTTNSIPRHSMGAQAGTPVPQQNIGEGGQVAGGQVYQPQQAAPLAQAYPVQSYENGAGNGASVSQARLASTPVSVERNVLTAPSAAPKHSAVALAQPMPGKLSAPAETPAAPSKAGWSGANAPSVTLRPGETVAGLARRYGVPEKEILRVNGLASAGQVQVGQQIIIPTFGKARNAAKDAAKTAEIPAGKLPEPGKEPVKETAALPSNGTLRGKQMADGAAKLPQAAGGGDAGGEGGSYTVKPGDSLARIAKKTGTNIDALKAANGLTATSIRVGQVLTLPGAAPAGQKTDQVKTASIPAKTDASAPAVAKPAAPVAAAEPVVAKETVTEAAAKTTDTETPDQTGIGKYRWPVRGAVIAGYGSNVEGNRNDGIDISVPSGTPIKAAENGVVIYAGNGLKELGNTVLVRHDDGTVTVYGNADALSVARGQKVQRGQTLASSGMSGNAKRPQVHFEVRKDATPVNPMTFLD